MKKTQMLVIAALLVLAAAPAALARSYPQQTVTCSGNGDNLPCKTPARLVCHSGSGKIVLSRIPKDHGLVWLTYKAQGVWRQSPMLTPVRGKVSVVWPGVRRAKGYIDVANPPPTAIPEMQFAISTGCGR